MEVVRRSSESAESIVCAVPPTLVLPLEGLALIDIDIWISWGVVSTINPQNVVSRDDRDVSGG
jgi:hypothetical protein